MNANRSNALLAWARPRRWSILGEAVLAAAVALIAIPAAALGNREPAPVEIVTDYLEALQDGDVERAETFVSESYLVEADRSWLTAEAMSADWQIASVELKSASETTVHAVITRGGDRVEGAFHLEGTDDDLLIVNPYMYLTNVSPMFASVEIGGVSGAVEAVDGIPIPVALYPGSYELFESDPALAGAESLSLLALPGSDNGAYSLDAIDFPAVMADPLTGDAAMETRLNEALAAWLDTCAESPDITPAGCPFGAVGFGTAAYDGRNEFETVGELDWAVAAHPKVRITRDLRLEAVEPGWMTLSGTGTALFDGNDEPLDGRCGVDIANIALVIAEDGTYNFATVLAQDNTCI
ncbi:hypothetical protein [Glycomyces harbinensis]|uniref:Uncharacterized protein n=1 Tax=Glycomyces harbinensis TaxID=58114 RepID=A0A1G6ZS05_9ACTN|nr:hypothetical protein [Glycomyces harbinensis]SDE05173.1 hypothetical protein SAMN05216270_111163 [Glycomyces harbinensis]